MVIKGSVATKERKGEEECEKKITGCGERSKWKRREE